MKEFYSNPASAELVASIDDIARKHSGRERVFDDWLTLTVCTLAGGTREDEYLQVVKPYCNGEPGKRDIDKLAALLGKLVRLMEETREDILGDIFQGAITRGHGGQFFTPNAICELMAKLTSADDAREGAETPEGSIEAGATESSIMKTVADPACGSGRILLAAAKENRNRYFVGQDIDHRCVKITAINLALWNLYGKVIWGNSLTLECKRVYHTGFNGRGAIRVEEPLAATEPLAPSVPVTSPLPIKEDEKLQQGSLFDCVTPDDKE